MEIEEHKSSKQPSQDESMRILKNVQIQLKSKQFSEIFLEEQQDIQGKELYELSVRLEHLNYRSLLSYLKNIQIDIMPGNYPNYENLSQLCKTLNNLPKINNKILWIRQEKIVTISECVQVAQIFFTQKMLKFALFYFSNMLSIEIYETQLFVEIRENMYITSEDLIQIFRIAANAKSNFTDIHIRIGENNPLSHQCIDSFANLIQQSNLSLKRLKVLIGKRNQLGSKLFSVLQETAFQNLETVEVEIGNNNDKLSTDSNCLFAFLTNQRALKSLSLIYSSNNSLNENSFLRLAESIKPLQYLQNITIQIGLWNRIQNIGCLQFTESIKSMNLSQIDLLFDGQNGITSEGASGLFDILRQFRKLQSIKIGFGDKSCLDERCMLNFARCIEQQQSLNALSLHLIHKLDYDISPLFKALQSKKSLFNLLIKIGSECPLLGNSVESLSTSLASLQALKNLTIDIAGCVKMSEHGIGLICSAITQIPNLIGLQLYLDEFQSNKKVDHLSSILEGNVKFTDLRFGYDIAFKFNFLKFEMEILQGQHWSEKVVLSLCKSLQKYTPIKEMKIRVDQRSVSKLPIKEVLHFLRYILMSLHRNPNSLRIHLCFESLIELYTQHALLDNLQLYENANQYLLDVSETNSFFPRPSQVLHITYKISQRQFLTQEQLGEIIILAAKLKFNGINVKSEFRRPTQPQIPGQQVMQIEDEDSEGEDIQEEEEEEEVVNPPMHAPQQPGGMFVPGQQNNDPAQIMENQYVDVLTTGLNAIKESVSYLSFELQGYFYFRVSPKKFNFYLFNKKRMPMQSLQRMATNLTMKTTNIREIEMTVGFINGQGAAHIRHLIENQPQLFILSISGGIKQTVENIAEMGLIYQQIRQFKNLYRLDLGYLRYLQIQENELPPVTPEEEQQLRNNLPYNLTEIVNILNANPQDQAALTNLQAAEQILIKERQDLRIKKHQTFLDSYQAKVDVATKQIQTRNSLIYQIRYAQLKISKQMSKNMFIDLFRTIFT